MIFGLGNYMLVYRTFLCIVKNCEAFLAQDGEMLDTNGVPQILELTDMIRDQTTRYVELYNVTTKVSNARTWRR